MRRPSLFFCELLAVGALSVGSVRAQFVTPAPVDLSGQVTAVSSGFQGAIAEGGEFFFWNAGDSVLSIEGFQIDCTAGCLDPSAHVSMADQALADNALANVYGPHIFSMSVAPTGVSSELVADLNLGGYVEFPAGSEWAISVGQVVTGTMHEIHDWIEQGNLTFAYSSTEGVFSGAKIGLIDFEPNDNPPVVTPPKPAPVDLGEAPQIEDESSALQLYLDATGELFVWNAADEAIPVDGFTFGCATGCLNPAGHVDLATQAGENSGLVDVYGAGVLGMGSANPSETAIANLNLSTPLNFPPGIDFAISLGRIFDGTPAEVQGWIDDGAVEFSYLSSGTVEFGAFQVVPEPSSWALALAATTGVAVARRSSRMRRR